MRVTKDQLSICMLRQKCNLSCRDCKYDGRCDPDFQKVMTSDIDTEQKLKMEVKIYGYQQI